MAQTSPITIDTFKTSYADMMAYLTYPYRIAVLGNQVNLAEFADSQGKLWAGHLGFFWSPPFLSAHYDPYWNINVNWLDAYNVGMVFYDRATGASAVESPSDAATEAFWYPSKMKLWKSYALGNSSFRFTSAKTSVPGYRAFGMRMTVENTGSQALNLNSFFLTSVKTFDKTSSWNWQSVASLNTALDASYNSATNMAIVANQQNDAFLGIGLSQYQSGWLMHPDRTVAYNQFRSTGTLSNTDQDTAFDANTTVNLAATLPTIPAGEAVTFSYIVAIGGNQSEVVNTFNQLKNQNIESLADAYWNNELSQLFQNIPHFTDAPNSLTSLYYRSFLHLLINKWVFSVTDPYVADKGYFALSGFFGGSMSQWPWDFGFWSEAFALADPAGMKTTIKRFLQYNATDCPAYDPITHTHRCPPQVPRYSYNPYSLVQTIYDYATTTGDTAFLSETYPANGMTKTVIEWMKYFADDGERRQKPDGLADFGNDSNVSEFLYGCPQLTGLYTGEVPAPNADRYYAYTHTADLMQKLGDTSGAQVYLSKANQAKTALVQLWNQSAGWFDTISLYNPDQSARTIPYRNTMWSAFVMPLVGFTELLSAQQVSALRTNINKFHDPVNNFGYTSLPYPPGNPHPWCTRVDFHGPGLYSGNVGQNFQNLFRSGFADDVYNEIFAPNNQGYQYLSKYPYWPQGHLYNAPTQAVDTNANNTAYIANVAIAQSFIKGMFGVEPTATMVRMTPHIPQALNGIGIENVRVQNHLIGLSVNGQNHTLNFTVQPASQPQSHIVFRYGGNGTLTANISHLLPGTAFVVKVIDVQNWTVIGFRGGNTSANGNLNFTYPLAGEYEFAVDPGVLPSPTMTPSPSPGYTFTQLKTLLINYLATDDSPYKPVEGKVNMLDAGYVVRWL